MSDGNQHGDRNLPEIVIEPSEPAETGQTAQVEEGYAVDRLKARFNRSMGDRPVMVYLVLLAGAATLLLLLAIVWISATGNNPEERPICTAISTDEASAAILAGQVERINILVDSDDPLQTLTGLVLEFTDGTCRQPAQGADVRGDLYRILGVVEVYNTFGEQRVRLNYQRQEIQDELLFTSTPTPSPTAIPPTETPTVPPTETTPPSPEPTATASVTVTPTLARSATEASPSSSPTIPLRTMVPTITPTITVSPTP